MTDAKAAPPPLACPGCGARISDENQPGTPQWRECGHCGSRLAAAVCRLRTKVRVAGPFSLAPLQAYLQRLTDGGLRPHDWNVVFLGVMPIQGAAGGKVLMVQPMDGGQGQGQIPVGPHYGVIHSVAACQHDNDPGNCKECKDGSDAHGR